MMGFKTRIGAEPHRFTPQIFRALYRYGITEGSKKELAAGRALLAYANAYINWILAGDEKEDEKARNAGAMKEQRRANLRRTIGSGRSAFFLKLADEELYADIARELVKISKTVSLPYLRTH